jgi:hypothetical protein
MKTQENNIMISENRQKPGAPSLYDDHASTLRAGARGSFPCGNFAGKDAGWRSDRPDMLHRDGATDPG